MLNKIIISKNLKLKLEDDFERIDHIKPWIMRRFWKPVLKEGITVDFFHLFESNLLKLTRILNLRSSFFDLSDFFFSYRSLRFLLCFFTSLSFESKEVVLQPKEQLNHIRVRGILGRGTIHDRGKSWREGIWVREGGVRSRREGIWIRERRWKIGERWEGNGE